MTMNESAVQTTPPRQDIPAQRIVYLLRHGETALNVKGVLQGSIDAPLNDTGCAQALALADKMATLGIRQIVASPQQRARQTADIIAQKLGLTVHEHADLRERDWGVHEGQHRDARTDVGEGVEAYTELHRRAANAFDDITQSCLFPCLIVTHSGLIKALMDRFGVPHPVSIGNCEFITLDLTDKGTFRVA